MRAWPRLSPSLRSHLRSSRSPWDAAGTTESPKAVRPQRRPPRKPRRSRQRRRLKRPKRTRTHPSLPSRCRPFRRGRLGFTGTATGYLGRRLPNGRVVQRGQPERLPGIRPDVSPHSGDQIREDGGRRIARCVRRFSDAESRGRGRTRIRATSRRRSKSNDPPHDARVKLYPPPLGVLKRRRRIRRYCPRRRGRRPIPRSCATRAPLGATSLSISF